MSRFDYPDPGIDPAYCDGLAATVIPFTDDDICPECQHEPCVCERDDEDDDNTDRDEADV